MATNKGQWTPSQAKAAGHKAGITHTARAKERRASEQASLAASRSLLSEIEPREIEREIAGEGQESTLQVQESLIPSPSLSAYADSTLAGVLARLANSPSLVTASNVAPIITALSSVRTALSPSVSTSVSGSAEEIAALRAKLLARIAPRTSRP